MQLNIIIIMVVIICLTLLIQMISEKSYMKKMKLRFKNEYGKKPDSDITSRPDEEEISGYYKLMKNTIPEDEIVDDITWDDLEMDRIFARINRTTSFIGEQLLYKVLHTVAKNKENLTQREKAIQYYDKNTDERIASQMQLMKLKKSPINYYIPEFMDTLEVQASPFFKLCRILQYSLALLAIASVLSFNTFVFSAACNNFLINLTIYALTKNKYEVIIASLYGVIHTVKVAKELNKSCCPSNRPEQTSLDKLSKMCKSAGALERKKSAGITGDITGIFYDYLIGALLWDYTTYDKVIHLLLKNKAHFMNLYTFVGEVDLSIAIGSFRQSLPGCCIPEFGSTGPKASGIYHPLIEDAVSNDFQYNKNIIITGSNASGKSTFIKAIAVNLILGQSIHTCTAADITIPNVQVLTSMAVRDDISSGESYYIKEIKYLKRMIDSSCKNRMVFCGIDEILRGTNTLERVAASISILKYLNEKNCILMVASHDLELAKTLDGCYENYYFCEQLQDGNVIFDYQLRNGISTANNAIRLLETMGFPPEIVAESRSISVGYTSTLAPDLNYKCFVSP